MPLVIYLFLLGYLLQVCQVLISVLRVVFVKMGDLFIHF